MVSWPNRDHSGCSRWVIRGPKAAKEPKITEEREGGKLGWHMESEEKAVVLLIYFRISKLLEENYIYH